MGGESKETILKITAPKETRAGDPGNFRLWLARVKAETLERTLVSKRAGIKKDAPGWVCQPKQVEGWIAVRRRRENCTLKNFITTLLLIG